MEQIAGIMTGLDVPSDRDQNVATIQLQNGDPQQVAQVLQNMFGGSSSTSRGGSSSSGSTSLLQTRAQNTATQMGSGTTTSTGTSGSGYGSGGGGGGGGGRNF
jgi:hypothetical protein